MLLCVSGVVNAQRCFSLHRDAEQDGSGQSRAGWTKPPVRQRFNKESAELVFHKLKGTRATEEVKLQLQTEGKVTDAILEAVNSLWKPVDSIPALLESFKITEHFN